jgi:hypothetical protein
VYLDTAVMYGTGTVESRVYLSNLLRSTSRYYRYIYMYVDLLVDLEVLRSTYLHVLVPLEVGLHVPTTNW